MNAIHAERLIAAKALAAEANIMCERLDRLLAEKDELKAEWARPIRIEPQRYHS